MLVGADWLSTVFWEYLWLEHALRYHPDPNRQSLASICEWEWLLNTKLLMICRSHVPVAISSQLALPPHPPVCSPGHPSTSVGQGISQYQLEMWWMTGGGRENKAPQSPSGSLLLPISLPFSPVLGSHPDHTHTWIFWSMMNPNLPAAGWAHRLLLQERKRPPWFISLSL